jgi:hypothetical protein
MFLGVDIVRIKAVNGQYHAVEEDRTSIILHTCDTQAAAINWAQLNGRKVNIHRERNMKSSDRHGQYRHQ